MSAVAKTLASAFTAAMSAAIVKTAEQWVRAEDDVTKRRVNFGRAVGRAAAAIMAAGGTDEDCESLIYPIVEESTGSRVQWDTVKDWVRAANVADSLKPDVAAVFNVEALKTIGRIPVKLSDKETAEGKLTREAFADLAIESGCTSVRDLRTAVASERASSSPKKAKTNASQAEETVQALKALVSDETSARFAGIDPDTLTACVMIGVLLRDKTPKHSVEAVTEGVAQFFGPNLTIEDDGSEAPDTV